MASENGLSIGQRIRQQRERLNWSQERLAESVGATKMSVRRWEHDTVLPQPYYREQLCRVFNVTTEMLFGVQEAEIAAPVPATGGGIWHVPHLRNPFFTGREEILQRMHTILSHEKTATLTQFYALSGLGGIGKTQTAIEYAYRYASQYAAILWVGAETYESLISSFVTLADMLNLPEKQEQEQKRVVSAVIRWLNSHTDWLLIFDNVEDIELVKGFLPPARSGSLLLTSRKQALGLTAQTLDLEKMTVEEGMCFLLRRARLLEPEASPDQLPAEDKAIAQEIVTAMDGLPLALDQAGAYIEATQCNLSDFLHIFQTHALHLLNKRDPHADHPASVVKTFALVFEQLQQVNPQAAELLHLCAFLAPDAIPEEPLKEGMSQLGSIFVSLAADPWQFNAVFEDLLAYSLIRRNPENKTFTVHRLVQAVLRERVPEEQQQHWIACTMHILDLLFPMLDMNTLKDIEHWSRCEQLLPHGLVCVQMNTDGNASVEELSLLKKMAIYLYLRTRYDEAERLFQSMPQKQLQVQESTVSDRAFVMRGLASTYREQGKYKADFNIRL